MLLITFQRTLKKHARGGGILIRLLSHWIRKHTADVWLSWVKEGAWKKLSFYSHTITGIIITSLPIIYSTFSWYNSLIFLWKISPSCISDSVLWWESNLSPVPGMDGDSNVANQSIAFPWPKKLSHGWACDLDLENEIQVDISWGYWKSDKLDFNLRHSVELENEANRAIVRVDTWRQNSWWWYCLGSWINLGEPLNALWLKALSVIFLSLATHLTHLAKPCLAACIADTTPALALTVIFTEMKNRFCNM